MAGSGREASDSSVLLVLALMGVGLWYALLRPTVKSLAEEAAQEQVAPVARQASAADTRAQQADDKAQQAVDAVAPGASPSPTPTVRPGVPAIPDGGQSSSRRLSVTAGAGAIGTDRYTVPFRRVFVLTDTFLQNP
ncbi:hypothetical protein U2F26_27215 [Micromonospora sp. 4G57]|uniref:Uncharacterized protein n=1 Tax=Micromonospora sicca TaxID=2202420 RepID=A0ABU5JLD8_9ACTN|nr:MULTISPECIES: hypothetical protein [unclassified Micromonospora]MDZ5446381.1 hypothetical protein [Micromonospora sp. 4G57]MDZ5493430.1 hypothetical protein [Micromonospora sp. 4G53]